MTDPANLPSPLAPSVGAANDLQQADGWLRITPWGEYPHRAGRQKIGTDDGQTMVTAYNSVRSRLARLFRGLPVFAGHPDMDAAAYPDRRRYGKVVDLETREDGLYGKVEWNDLGQQAMEQGHYLYASPAWRLRRDGNFVRPTELISVGLTNTPNIPGDPWAENERTEMLPAWLQSALVKSGRLVAGETDEAKIETAFNALLADAGRVPDLAANVATLTTERDALRAGNDKAAAELTAANAKLGAAEAATAAERAERVKLELAAAVGAGRITQADVTAWNDKFAADFPGTLTALREAKIAVNTQQQSASLGERKDPKTELTGRARVEAAFKSR
jgi:phage I-like protein